VAVEGHSRFEPQRVAGAKAHRHAAVGCGVSHQPLPDRQGRVGRAQNLYTVFAGVAGAADVDPVAVERGRGAAVVLERRRGAAGEHVGRRHGARALDGDHGRRQRAVGHLCVEARGVLVKPRHQLVAVAGVDHHAQGGVLAPDLGRGGGPVHQHVVQHAARFVAHQPVADAARAQV